MWSFDRITALVSEAKIMNADLRALAVLNAADLQGQDNSEAQDVLSEVEGIETLSGVIVRRKAFRNAAAQGRSVLDMSPKDPKAVEEVTALVQAIF